MYPQRRHNDAVFWYMSELSSRVVAETGIPSDRNHLGKLILRGLKDAPDFVLQVSKIFSVDVYLYLVTLCLSTRSGFCCGCGDPVARPESSQTRTPRRDGFWDVHRPSQTPALVAQKSNKRKYIKARAIDCLKEISNNSHCYVASRLVVLWYSLCVTSVVHLI